MAALKSKSKMAKMDEAKAAALKRAALKADKRSQKRQERKINAAERKRRVRLTPPRVVFPSPSFVFRAANHSVLLRPPPAAQEKEERALKHQERLRKAAEAKAVKAAAKAARKAAALEKRKRKAARKAAHHAAFLAAEAKREQARQELARATQAAGSGSKKKTNSRKKKSKSQASSALLPLPDDDALVLQPATVDRARVTQGRRSRSMIINFASSSSSSSSSSSASSGPGSGRRGGVDQRIAEIRDLRSMLRAKQQRSGKRAAAESKERAAKRQKRIEKDQTVVKLQTSLSTSEKLIDKLQAERARLASRLASIDAAIEANTAHCDAIRANIASVESSFLEAAAAAKAAEADADAADAAAAAAAAADRDGEAHTGSQPTQSRKRKRAVEDAADGSGMDGGEPERELQEEGEGAKRSRDQEGMSVAQFLSAQKHKVQHAKAKAASNSEFRERLFLSDTPERGVNLSLVTAVAGVSPGATALGGLMVPMDAVSTAFGGKPATPIAARLSELTAAAPAAPSSPSLPSRARTLDESPLAAFKALRLSPLFATVSRAAGLGDPSVSNKIDPHSIVCRFELFGACNNADCSFQHLRDMALSEEELLVDLAAYAVAAGKGAPAGGAPLSKAAADLAQRLKAQCPVGSDLVEYVASQVAARLGLSSAHGFPMDRRSWTPALAVVRTRSKRELASGGAAGRALPPPTTLGSARTGKGAHGSRYYAGTDGGPGSAAAIAATATRAALEAQLAVIEDGGDTAAIRPALARLLVAAVASSAGGGGGDATALDDGIEALARALEGFPESEPVWVCYLSLFRRRSGGRMPGPEFLGLCASSVDYVPASPLLATVCAMSQPSYAARVNFCESLLASATGVSPDGEVLVDGTLRHKLSPGDCASLIARLGYVMSLIRTPLCGAGWGELF